MTGPEFSAWIDALLASGMPPLDVLVEVESLLLDHPENAALLVQAVFGRRLTAKEVQERTLTAAEVRNVEWVPL